MDAAAAKGDEGAGRRPRTGFAARLFGYDVFISFALGPPPRGTQSYASDLARRLRERDLAVFFSEDQAAPGDRLDSTLARALYRSRTLVVVANRGTLAAPRWVRTEVEEFRRRHPGRAIIPISVGGALQDAALAESVRDWLPFENHIWLDERTEAVDQGIASAALVERLALAPAGVRANAAWRWLTRGTMALLAGLLVAVAIAAKTARDNAGRALAELREAQALRLTGEAAALLSGEAPGGDERALQSLLAAHRLAPGVAVEGGLLNALVRRASLVKLVTTPAAPLAVAYSPDGHTLYTGEGDGRLRRWDAVSGRALGAFADKHFGGVITLAVSRDGRRIASGGPAGTLRLWDAASGAALAPPVAVDKGWITHVAFSIDGTRVLTVAGQIGSARWWDAVSGAALADPFGGRLGRVTTAAFAPDGRRLLVGSGEGSLRDWDLASGEALGPPRPAHGKGVALIAYSADGARLVTVGGDGALRLWDGASGDAVGQSWRGVGGFGLALTGDGRRVVVSDAKRRLVVIDAATGTPLGAPREGHRDEVWSLAVSPDGRQFASVGSGDRSLRLWALDDDAALGRPLEGAPQDVRSLALAGDGRRLVTGHGDGSLRLWDAVSGRPLPVAFAGHAAAVTGLAFLGDERIVSGGEDHSLRRWQAADGRAVEPALALADKVKLVAASGDGRRIASAEWDRVRLWDAADGRALGEWSLGASGSWLNGLAFSADGTQLVVTGANDKTPHLLDGHTAADRGRLAGGHDNGLTAAAFSPDGRRLASGDLGGLLRLWDLARAAPEGGPLGDPLAGLRGTLRALAFTPDGAFLLAGHDDGLRFRDAASGEAVGAVLTEARPVQQLAVSRDGRLVAAIAGNGVRLWPAPARWADELCARLGRNMSRAEWRRRVSGEIGYRCQCAGLAIAPDSGEAVTEQCTGAPPP